MCFLSKLHLCIRNLCKQRLSIHMFPKTVAMKHFTSRHESRNKPNTEAPGATQARNSCYFCALCHWHTFTPHHHLVSNRCLGSPSLQEASTTFPGTRGCTRYPQHCSPGTLWGMLTTLFNLPESQGHVPPASRCQHNHLNILRTVPGCL